MTVIAYRDGVLAGDTQLVINGIRVGHADKVFNHRGWLFGWCGDSGVAHLVRGRIDDAGDGPNYERMNEYWPTFPPDFTCILVSPDGQVCDIGVNSRWEPIRTPFLAIGAGCEIATGAMDQGADAEEAVRAAIRRCSRCGGQVTAVRLDPGLCVRQLEPVLSVARAECICISGAGLNGPHHNRGCPSWRPPA